MNEEQFTILCKKLDKIMALLATQGIEDQNKKIIILKKLNLTSLEVGNVLGLSESTIRNSKGWKEKWMIKPKDY